MRARELFGVMQRGGPIDFNALADTRYTGIDLTMPTWFHQIMWRTFRKTFHRDPKTGVLRGWNVKVEQSGWETPPSPKRDHRGRPLTFGHYEVRAGADLAFPRGLRVAQYLDYTVAGNVACDLARFAMCPLVTVNDGEYDLLLGWEVFRVGAHFLPIDDFWVLKREGALDPREVQPRPRR
jgi:hypothetical protein